MKKKILIVILASFFILIPKSNALVYVNDTQLTKNQVIYNYANDVSLKIESPYYTLRQGQAYHRLYGVVVLCTNNTSLQNAATNNVSVQYTDIACTLPDNIGTDWPEAEDGVEQIYDGNLVYLLVSWDITDSIPGDETLATRKFSATFSIDNSPWHTYALIQDMYSYEPIDFDLSSKTLIEQNKEIIQQNQETIEKLEEQNQKVQQQIEEQEKTNQELGELNDNLTNSDVDSSSADGFFSNFNTEDNGGLSSVVTAPLRFVQKLTNSCTPIKFTLYGKEITLPCGDTLFWNKESIQTFRVTWNILFGGAIIYALLVKLFKVIQNLKDPNNSKVEVMDL